MKNQPWSYSRLKAFETCPFQFYHTKVAKTYDEPETEAIRYGNLFHEAAEQYIQHGTPLPETFQFASGALDRLNRYPGDKLCEYKMGVRSDLTACDFWDTDNVWFRGIADLCIINTDERKAKVVDYKTGKSARYADTGQLELMALATFAHFPEVDTAQTALLFVVAKELIPKTFTRDDIPGLWREWLTRHAVMERAFKNDVWNPRPSGLCQKWCAVLECPHNGRN